MYVYIVPNHSRRRQIQLYDDERFSNTTTMFIHIVVHFGVLY